MLTLLSTHPFIFRIIDIGFCFHFVVVLGLAISVFEKCYFIKMKEDTIAIAVGTLFETKRLHGNGYCGSAGGLDGSRGKRNSHWSDCSECVLVREEGDRIEFNSTSAGSLAHWLAGSLAGWLGVGMEETGILCECR